jgi:hypothetical protein
MKKNDTDDNEITALSRRTFLGGVGGTAAASVIPSYLRALAAKSLDLGQPLRASLTEATPGRIHFPYVFAPEEDYVKPVERPFRQDICLNGAWEFQPISLPAGFQEGHDPAPVLPAPEQGQWEARPLYVPSPWNVNSFADHRGQGGDFRCYPSYPQEWEAVSMGWLRKTFTVPANWTGRSLSLHFEAVAGDAVVIVNGKTLGSHFDIFLPFSFDATAAINIGATNEVLVGVRKPSLFDKRGTYGRRTYQGGSFWGQHIAGIWQDVFLVSAPPVRVSDLYVLPKVDEDKLQVEITVTNDSDRDREVSLDAQVFPWISRAGKSALAAPMPSSELGTHPHLELPAVPLTVPAHGTANATLQSTVGNRLGQWNSTQPNLYGLVVRIRDQAQVIDRKYTRFGWRQITFRGSEVLLNGEPLILRGDSWHFMGIPQMTRRYAWAWYTAMRRAGLNAVRLHAQPYPTFYLDVADEMGILVLDESAMWASDAGPKLDDPVFWKDTERHLTDLIQRDRNHPSVFGWSVCNEMRPIVLTVLRNPPGMMDELTRHYTIWADICRRLDPSRLWISADGDEDGEGKLPVFLIHYGGVEDMERAEATGKPWGVGEAGNAYYGTPEQVSETNGERAYESFEGRMEGVAISSYQILIEQVTQHASYRSVFNLVWYGLQPLPLGLKDTSKPPVLEDGIAFAKNVEGKPGVQPERLGPYCSTLNPGYDASLPMYRTWPLFEAIRDAAADPPVKGKWSRSPAAAIPPAAPTITPVASARVLAGAKSTLAAELTAIGVPMEHLATADAPQLLFIDGANPPGVDALALIQHVCNGGGTVLVWGAAPDTVPKLNALLPAPLSITQRSASSLLPSATSPVTYRLKPSNLYFCDQRPSEFTSAGLGGTLIERSVVLLKDCDTDWMKWNGQPEYAKTVMVFRSEREAKPSGVVLAEMRAGSGRILLTTLPSAPKTIKAERIPRTILANLGVQLQSGMDVGKPLLKTGILVRALACGYFDSGAETSSEPWKSNSFRANTTMNGKEWRPVFQESGIFDLNRLNLSGSFPKPEVYLSFWVFSPRSLDELLLEPNVPQLNLQLTQRDGIEIWLNDEPQTIADAKGEPGITIAGLKLRAGWNHFLLKLTQDRGSRQFALRFTSNQPEFLAQLDSALEGP